MRNVIRLSLVTLLFAPPLVAQGQVVRKVLTRPEAEFTESFDQIQSLRELSAGRVLVTDLGPRTVVLANFSSGTVTPVGRNGQGPGEYQQPGDLIAGTADTTLLVDRASRRFLLIKPDGTMGPTVPFPDQLMGFPEPRGVDRQGRIYFQGSPFGGPGAETAEIPESVAVVRWQRGATRLDTVVTVKIPSIKMQVSNQGNARAVMMRPQPFAAQDEWQVTTDGRVAVGRVGDYHVEWVGTGAAVVGARVAYQPVKVDAADRAAFLSGMRNTRNRITVNVGGGGRELKPPEVNEADFDWPAVKPPFTGRGSYMAPEGQLWLQHSTATQDSTAMYDVFDGTGRQTAQVTLPRGRRLVGLGQGTLYATRTDADGLQWLERYRR
ncbi:MAG: hypothetical protein ABI587_07615 [Gemmatimonadales bacterium]